jgi:hypothetical protein
MNLVTGAAWASGRVSDSVVELLRRKGEPVRVIERRDDARAKRFRDLGAEVVVADLATLDSIGTRGGPAIQALVDWGRAQLDYFVGFLTHGVDGFSTAQLATSTGSVGVTPRWRTRHRRRQPRTSSDKPQLPGLFPRQ